MTGTYAFSGSAKERKQRSKAIEKAVKELFFAWRGVARRRIARGTKIAKTVTLERDGAKVQLSQHGRTYALVLGGPLVKVTGRGGKKIKARAYERGPSLVVEFRSSQGGMYETFTPQPKGTLAMDVHVWSKRLPKPVKYRLSYVKR